MSIRDEIEFAPTHKFRIVRRWLRRDIFQQEYVATNLSPESDRITEWWDVPVVKYRDT